MPITIQEIIASDTISQLVDKTNFNFDQLLLNGGGPAGPAGPAGPTGPGGGRGEKGSTWYEDTATVTPGNTPTAVPPTATPLSGDYYLQFNGDVWEYNGTVWVITTVDLQGPIGPSGADGGFGLDFGAVTILKQNTIYTGPIGLGNGANATNEGVPSIMMGGVVSDTVPLTGISFTTAYTIPDDIALAITSDIASVVVHQKDSDGRSLVFHGGGANVTDLYEQSSISQLSGIKIGVDDVLTLDVPKSSNPNAAAQVMMRGIHLTSPERGQFFEAGSDILMQTGTDTDTEIFAGQHSNFAITVGPGSDTAGSKFVLSTQGGAGDTLTEAGNLGVLETDTVRTGKWQAQAGEIRLVSSAADEIGLYSGGSILLTTKEGTAPTGQIRLLTESGGIGMEATSGNITQTTTTGNNTTSTTSGNISLSTTANTGGDILLKATYGDINILNELGGNINIWSSYTSGVSNISIYAGIASGTGSIGLRSRLLDTTIDAVDADVVIQNNSKTRVQFLGGTALPAGRIMVGGGTSPVGTSTYTVYKPLIVIDSTEIYGSDLATNTIHVSISPQAGVANLNPLGPGYNGGGEIIGPYAVAVETGGSVAPWQAENEGTLHIRSNVVRGTWSGRTGSPPPTNTTETTLPGSLWMYPTIPTQTDDSDSSADGGENINASVRLWSTPKPPYGSGNTFVGTPGITIGLNSIEESAITPTSAYGKTGIGTPVSGRTYLYGQRALVDGADVLSGTALDQNIAPISGSAETFAGGVNIGDQWRGRQAFKVWGDYIGNYYVSAFGGAVSGNSDPDGRVEQQCFMSGGQGWSPIWIDNMGSTDSQKQDAARFKYKYQWQRVGRVVTGSGMIKTSVSRTGGSGQGGSYYPVPSNELVTWGGTYGSSINTANNYEVIIGPMSWPMQVGDNNTTDTASPISGKLGVDNRNISGTVVSVLDGQTGSTVTTNPINYANGNSTLILSSLPTGVVGGGTASTMYDADPTPSASTATAMWLKVYPLLSGPIGMVPSYLKFTFSYEVNEQ